MPTTHTRPRRFVPIANITFALLAAIILRPLVWLFDRIADALYRPKDVKSVDACVSRVCRLAEQYYGTNRRSWASLVRRSGYRRFHHQITFELLRDEFRRNPATCSSWQAYTEDIRWTPAWGVSARLTDGRYEAGYRHNDPEKRRQYFYQTQEEACARFLLGFLEEV